MLFQFFKALHIIAILAWSATLFYVLRLLIYQAKTLKMTEPERSVLGEQNKRMVRSVWVPVGWTSAILVLIFGAGLMHPYFSHTWFLVKMAMVLFLYILHQLVHIAVKKMRKDKFTYSLAGLRHLLNFVIVLLTGIVVLAVFKDNINYICLSGGIFLFYIVLWIKTSFFTRREV